MPRRALLLAVLVYVIFDFSLPWVQGAFVFEAGDSVDGIQISRSRLAAEAPTLSAPQGNPFVLLPPRIDLRHRKPPISDIVSLAKPEARCLPRADCAASPLSSEDPH